MDPNNTFSDVHLPKILLAGVQKSGSTALTDFVHRAGACLSRPDPSQEKEKKEVHFFDTKLYTKGLHYYSNLFAHCKDMRVAVDGTPNTFLYPHRVKETYNLAGKNALDELKIIIVVREPVARELSLYNHMSDDCRGDDLNKCKQWERGHMLKSHNKSDSGQALRTFPEYADHMFGDYVLDHLPTERQELLTGWYGDKFEQWFHHFDRKQILVLSYSELKQDESSFLERVISFLNLDVDPTMIQSGTKTKNDHASSLKMELPPCDVQDRMAKMFKPSNDKFFDMMDYGEEGPTMEQRPFPRFVLSNCTSSTSTSSVSDSSLDSDQVQMNTPQTQEARIDPNNTFSDVHLPKILLAGVQKSGSTALTDFVHRAGACLSRPDPSQEKEKKEVHFFDTKLYTKGLHYYSNLFAHCKDMRVAVDGTPNTFLYPHRVKETYNLAGKNALDELKIIIVVREPVARELSLYNHMSDDCRGDDLNKCKQWERGHMLKSHNKSDSGQALRTFPEYADHMFGDYVLDHLPTERQELLTGWYGDKFEQWFHHFDRKQILVLSYSELKQDESSFLERVISFLNLDVDPTMIQSGTKTKNDHASSLKMELPPCDVQDRMAKMFKPSNDKFFDMMDYGEEGPTMEQRPFPRFVLSNCTSSTSTSSVSDSSLDPGLVQTINPQVQEARIDPNNTFSDASSNVVSNSSSHKGGPSAPYSREQMSPNFLSFDLGGSGLKFLPMSITADEDSTGIPVKHAMPIDDEVNLGRIPVPYSPRDWIEELILSQLGLLSMVDWPHFALSGKANTYKLWGKSEHEAVFKLTNESNQLNVGCTEISTDIPSWAEEIKFWCNKWRPAHEVLGMSNNSC